MRNTRKKRSLNRFDNKRKTFGDNKITIGRSFVVTNDRSFVVANGRSFVVANGCSFAVTRRFLGFWWRYSPIFYKLVGSPQKNDLARILRSKGPSPINL